jgi:hypothetical protein
VVPPGKTREEAEALAREIARYPDFSWTVVRGAGG